jgi:hypothetical protein
MAGPTTTKHAEAVAGRVGALPAILQQIIAFLMSLFGGCLPVPTPAAALAIMQAQAADPRNNPDARYFGWRVHDVLFNQAVRKFAPGQEEVIRAGLSDEVDVLTLDDVTGMLAENPKP